MTRIEAVCVGCEHHVVNQNKYGCCDYYSFPSKDEMKPVCLPYVPVPCPRKMEHVIMGQGKDEQELLCNLTV